MKSSSDNNGAPWWRDGLLLFSKLSGWIGIPIVAALFLGRWLDKKYDSEPWLFLASVGLAFALSMTGIVKEARKAMDEISLQEKKESKDEKKNDRSK